MMSLASLSGGDLNSFTVTDGKTTNFTSSSSSCSCSEGDGFEKYAEIVLAFIRFVGRISSYQNTYYVLQFFYNLFPSYCPLWFYHLQLMEQLVTYSWNSCEMKDRLLMTKIDPVLEEAGQYLSNDLLWKMYTSAAQAEIRGYTHIRMLLRQRGVRE